MDTIVVQGAQRWLGLQHPLKKCKIAMFLYIDDVDEFNRNNENAVLSFEY